MKTVKMTTHDSKTFVRHTSERSSWVQLRKDAEEITRMIRNRSHVKSTDFGRNAREQVRKLREDKLLGLDVDRKEAAVLISTETLDKLVTFLEQTNQALEQEMDDAVAAAQNEYNAYLQRVAQQSQPSAQSILMGLSGDQLAETYQPARTETD